MKSKYSVWAGIGLLTFVGIELSLTAKSSLAANLVINGSFEKVALPKNSWTTFPYGYEAPSFHNLASIPGWKVEPGSRFELQRYAAGSPAEGFQFVELDASLTQRGSIYQDILTEPGLMYDLKFAFSPRRNTPISDNILQVNWGNEIVDTLSENGIGLADNVWKYYTYTLLATSNTTRLEFFDLGTTNHRGTYIDDVSVERVEPIVKESVPEPSSVLGLLLFSIFGLARRKKY